MVGWRSLSFTRLVRGSQIMSIASSLLTAAEFGQLPDPGHPQELFRGVIVDMPLTSPRHGQVCMKIGAKLTVFAEEHHLGHVFGNDGGVVTERSPDTVRGPDVAFISFAKIPPGPLPGKYLTVPPDAVFEVLSPSDRRSEVHRKVAEYLDMGVPAVYVFDPEMRRVQCYFADRPDEVLTTADEFTGCGPLTGLKVSVAKFFE